MAANALPTEVHVTNPPTVLDQWTKIQIDIKGYIKNTHLKLGLSEYNQNQKENRMYSPRPKSTFEYLLFVFTNKHDRNLRGGGLFQKNASGVRETKQSYGHFLFEGVLTLFHSMGGVFPIFNIFIF